MNYSDQLRGRLQRLRLRPDQLGLKAEFELLQDRELRNFDDWSLRACLESAVAEVEEELRDCPFKQPGSEANLGSGRIHLLNTQPDNHAIRIQCEPGSPTSFSHLCPLGPTGTGKTSLLIQLASEAASNCKTLIIDSLKAFRRSSAIRRTHQFVRVSDLRLNLWDAGAGVRTGVHDQTINTELARNYGLQFALYEINEAVAELRAKGVPNLISVIETLERKKYQNFSRRSQYRDSAVLILSNLLTATGELFRCAQGMPVESLLNGNIVLEIDELMPEHARFLIRFFFEHLHLRSLGAT